MAASAVARMAGPSLLKAFGGPWLDGDRTGISISPHALFLNVKPGDICVIEVGEAFRTFSFRRDGSNSRFSHISLPHVSSVSPI